MTKMKRPTPNRLRSNKRVQRTGGEAARVVRTPVAAGRHAPELGRADTVTMPTFHTVVPIHNVDLSRDTSVELGGGVRLTATPTWVRDQKLLERASAQDREAVQRAAHAFVVSYEAAALGDPDPGSTPAGSKSIQESKYELCVLANLALWLSKPSPVCFTIVIHAPQFGNEPVAQQVQSHSTLLCHPQDIEARITASDLDIAQKLHRGLVTVKPTSAVFTAIRATWAGLQMNMEAIRYALFWIALEALFGPEDAREITYRLSQRLAFFLAANREEAKNLFLMTKKGYGFRSKIVHGRWKEEPESAARMAEVEALVRRSLVLVIETNDLRSTFSGSAREPFLDNLVWRST